MYSVEDVYYSLESEKLSEALFKLENLAENHSLTELAEWCSKELNGYEEIDRNDEKSNHRVIDVIWRTSYGQFLRLTKEFSAVNRIHMFRGVPELELHENDGMNYMPHELCETLSKLYRTEVTHAEIFSTTIKALLGKIRLIAKRKLQQAFPKNNLKKTSYPSPNFTNLVSDVDLAKILSNRWNEANLAFESRAYLATVILLGSILEGVLLDKVEQNQTQAVASSKCPRDRNGNPLPFEKWTLEKLIEVTHDCGWLKKEAKDFSHVVRDYRNFVHPNKERREGIKFEEPICKVIWEVITVALN
jgi:AbiTii